MADESATLDLAALVGEDFSGVVAVRRSGSRLDFEMRGHADRAQQLENTLGTRFACASAAKTFTALAVLRLVERGDLRLDKPIAPLVPELTQLHPAITVQHLLEHTSGAGDYLPEDDDTDIEDVQLALPVSELDTPASILPMLDLPPDDEPGAGFSYNNGGYVLLAVAAERASGRDYYSLTQEIFAAARMGDSGFFRTDDLPPNTALGYRRDGRTNIDDLPVRGNGDGGVFLTAADVQWFWSALRDGRLLDPSLVGQMTSPQQHAGRDGYYGWGMWLNADGTEWSMEGMDSGVSFRSTHVPSRGLTATVLSNTTSGAWPVARALREVLALG